MKHKEGTTTITMSIPVELKTFFDDLSDNGFNRSYLLQRMTLILCELYNNQACYPGGLHGAVNNLLAWIKAGNMSPLPVAGLARPSRPTSPTTHEE